MLQALADGEEDAATRAQLAKGKPKAKAAPLKQTLTGHLTSTHRFLLQELVRHYDHLDEAMARTAAEIQRQIQESPDPFLPQAVDLLHTIPGVGARVAETLVSALGADLTCCPTAGHLASWAGMGPGNHQSAGKQRSSHTRKENVDVRGALTQAAWAATRTKHTCLAAQFRRLPTRLGQRRALVAVGHSVLVIAWHLLSTHASSQELGRDDFDRSDAQAYRLQLIRTLEALGLTVVVEPAPRVSEASSVS
jgi:transposase